MKSDDSGMRAQSAMEYLMTYGWSILIIAIVLAALFSLGVFSNSNLGPRAQPNSCRVFRPNGIGTTTNINLEGTCNGELPEYVGLFNGQTSWVVAGDNGLSSGGGSISEFAWVDLSPQLNNYPTILGLASGGGQINVYTPGAAANTVYNPRMCANACEIDSRLFSINQWAMIGFTYSTSTGLTTIYLNGVGGTPISTGASNPTSSPACIGSCNNPLSYEFNGMIANVQIYDYALDANAVQALYLEGIGGAPVQPQYLVSWWPLDGDTNDYSGNANNGASGNVMFTSSWTSGYTTP